MSNLLLLTTQIVSLEAAERELIIFDEEKDIAGLHVRLQRALKIDEDRRQEHNTRELQLARSRERTISRRLVLLGNEEQKERLAITRSEVLHLEALVRASTKSVRSEVFTATQQAQHRIKYFHKALDVIYKKESGGRREITGSERYEYLVLTQKWDRQLTELQRQLIVEKVREQQQIAHDEERRRKGELKLSHRSFRRSVVTTSAALSNSSKRRSQVSPEQRHLELEHEETKENDGPTQEEEEEKQLDSGTDHAPPHQHKKGSGSPSAAEKRTNKSRREKKRTSPHSSRSSSAASSRSSQSRSSRSVSSSSSSSLDGIKRHSSSSSPRKETAASSAVADSGPKKANHNATELSASRSTTGAATGLTSSSTGRQRPRSQPLPSWLAQSQEFFEKALKHCEDTESSKRSGIIKQWEARNQNLGRHIAFLEQRERERKEDLDMQQHGHPAAVQRWQTRVVTKFLKEESDARAAIETQADLRMHALQRQLAKRHLEDRHDEELRMARYLSHEHRVRRKLQRVEANRQTMNEATKEACLLLCKQLDPLGELPPPSSAHAADRNGGTATKRSKASLSSKEAAKDALAAADPNGSLPDSQWKKLDAAEDAGRQKILNDALQRYDTLTYSHQQKLVAFGVLDKNEVRKLRQAAVDSNKDKDREGIEEKLHAAKEQSQWRQNCALERDRLLKDELQLRSQILQEAAGLHRSAQTWLSGCTKLLGLQRSLCETESQLRESIAQQEQNAREPLSEASKKYKPRKPVRLPDPLPPPRLQFEEAQKVYRKFLKQQKKNLQQQASSSSSKAPKTAPHDTDENESVSQKAKHDAVVAEEANESSTEPISARSPKANSNEGEVAAENDAHVRPEAAVEESSKKKNNDGEAEEGGAVAASSSKKQPSETKKSKKADWATSRDALVKSQQSAQRRPISTIASLLQQEGALPVWHTVKIAPTPPPGSLYGATTRKPRPPPRSLATLPARPHTSPRPTSSDGSLRPAIVPSKPKEGATHKKPPARLQPLETKNNRPVKPQNKKGASGSAPSATPEKHPKRYEEPRSASPASRSTSSSSRSRSPSSSAVSSPRSSRSPSFSRHSSSSSVSSRSPTPIKGEVESPGARRESHASVKSSSSAAAKPPQNRVQEQESPRRPSSDHSSSRSVSISPESAASDDEGPPPTTLAVRTSMKPAEGDAAAAATEEDADATAQQGTTVSLTLPVSTSGHPPPAASNGGGGGGDDSPTKRRKSSVTLVVVENTTTVAVVAPSAEDATMKGGTSASTAEPTAVVTSTKSDEHPTDDYGSDEFDEEEDG